MHYKPYKPITPVNPTPQCPRTERALQSPTSLLLERMVLHIDRQLPSEGKHRANTGGSLL